jgi:PAS domain S-box-containing protein
MFSAMNWANLLKKGAMRRVRPYLAAIGIVAIASVARQAITPILGNSFPLITYWPATVVIAYFFGFRAALFTIGISLIAGRLFFMRPLHPLLFPAPVDVVFASFFAVFTVCVAMFMESLRMARMEAESNATLAKQRLKALEAEVAARQTERSWAESVLASIGDGVIAADSKGIVTYTNSVAAQLTGWSPEEAARQPVTRVFYTIEQDPHSLLAATDGRVIPIEHNTSVIRDSDGLEVGKVVVFRDITAQRKGQEALEASEKRLHASLKAAGSAAWEWNTETGEIICSKEFRELTGVRAHADYIDFESWMQSAHQDDRRQLENELLSATKHGSECRLEHRAWRDGEVRWLTLLGKMSGPGRMTGIVVDVTDRHRMEEKLRNAAKQESLGVLSGGIAHDFNNLLTTILGYASMLRSEVIPDSAAADYARNIEISSERAAHLTRQILAYSGQGRFAVERIDLSAHVRRCVSDLDGIHASKLGNRIRLRMNLEQGLPTIKADPRQVDQVVTSILTNSIEAIGDDPGCIQIKAKSRTISGSDRTGDVPAGRYVVLEVSDNGPGMDEITKAKIFDPFFTTKFMGRGLGLAAVHGIVRGHGGAIHLESRPGEGTAFQIFWPTSTASE